MPSLSKSFKKISLSFAKFNVIYGGAFRVTDAGVFATATNAGGGGAFATATYTGGVFSIATYAVAALASLRQILGIVMP